MAKLMIAALTFIAGVCLVEASPVLGGLNAVGQQGALGNGGLVGNLVSGINEGLSILMGLTEAAAERAIREETMAGARATAQGAASGAMEARRRGLTKEQALVLCQEEVMKQTRPVVSRIAAIAAQSAVEHVYGQTSPAASQGLDLLGGK